MKYILFLLLLFLSACASINSLERDRYRAAINYIDKDLKPKTYNVVDTLIYISQTQWYQEKPEREYNDYDFLLKLDSINEFKNTYFTFNKKNPSGELNVYFSKPIDNYLDAEIVPNRGKSNGSKKELTRFNMVYMYKFEFNKQNEIVDVLKYINYYD